MGKKKTTKEFITDAVRVHGDKYDYSKVEYVNVRTKVLIICPIHGDFEQTPNAHLVGRGCKLCGITAVVTKTTKNTKTFKEEAINKHNYYYTYDNVLYKNAYTKVTITCPIHGDFEQTPGNHLSGKGCPKCKGKTTQTTESVISKFIKNHGTRYGYSKVNYKNSGTKVIITCAEHGDFEQTPNSHLSGHNCPKCNNHYDIEERGGIFKNNTINVHGNKYYYGKVDYVNAKTKVTITCPTHGDFEQTPDDHLRGRGCPKCSLSGPSKSEIEILEYLDSISITAETSNRKILNGLELDIYIPEHNIAIEFNGLYWHSNKFKSNTYHLNKTELCEKQAIQLIHIFENEWLYEQSLVKKRLWNLFNPTDLKETGDYDLSKDYIELDRRYYNGLDGYEVIGFTNPTNYYVIGNIITERKQKHKIWDCGVVRLRKLE